MSIAAFISKQPEERQELLSKIHAIILREDKTVQASIEPMMGKEMIIYKTNNFFKYGLSSVKNYMSLHVMPIYGSVKLYSKYQALLKDAKFQKGCINFTNKSSMPLDIVKELMADCAKIDLQAMKESFKKSKKS